MNKLITNDTHRKGGILVNRTTYLRHIYVTGGVIYNECLKNVILHE